MFFIIFFIQFKLYILNIFILHLFKLREYTKTNLQTLKIYIKKPLNYVKQIPILIKIYTTINTWYIRNMFQIVRVIHQIPLIFWICNLFLHTLNFCLSNGFFFITLCMSEETHPTNSNPWFLTKLWEMCCGSNQSGELDYYRKIDSELNSNGGLKIIKRRISFDEESDLLKFQDYERGLRKMRLQWNTDLLIKQNNYYIDVLADLNIESRQHSLLWHSGIVETLIKNHNTLIDESAILSVWDVNPIMSYKDMARSYLAINKELFFLQNRYIDQHIFPHFQLPTLLSIHYKPWVFYIDLKLNYQHDLTNHVFQFLNTHSEELIDDDVRVCFSYDSSIYMDPGYPYLEECEEEEVYPDSRIHLIIRHLGLGIFNHPDEIDVVFKYAPDSEKWTDQYKRFVDYKCSRLLHPTQRLNELIHFPERSGWDDWSYEGCWKQYSTRPGPMENQNETDSQSSETETVSIVESTEPRILLLGGHLNSGMSHIRIYPEYFHIDSVHRNTNPEFQPRVDVLDMNKVYKEKELFPSPIYKSFQYDHEIFTGAESLLSEMEKAYGIHGFQKIKTTNPFVTNKEVMKDFTWGFGLSEPKDS